MLAEANKTLLIIDSCCVEEPTEIIAAPIIKDPKTILNESLFAEASILRRKGSNSRNLIFQLKVSDDNLSHKVSIRRGVFR